MSEMPRSRQRPCQIVTEKRPTSVRRRYKGETVTG
jgi:hypothetical protein